MPLSTSLRTVSFTLSRRECGSVQIHLASTRWRPRSPRTRRTHIASSSADSASYATHCGLRYHLPHVRHISTSSDGSIADAMLVVTLRHAMHVPSATASAGVGAPQRQQAIVPTVWVGRCMAAKIARGAAAAEQRRRRRGRRSSIRLREILLQLMTAAVSQTTLRVDVASTKAGSKEEDVTNEFRALEQLAADLATRMQALSVSRGQLKGLASETAAGHELGHRPTHPAVHLGREGALERVPRERLAAEALAGAGLRPGALEQSMGMTSGIGAKRDEPYDSTRGGARVSACLEAS